MNKIYTTILVIFIGSLISAVFLGIVISPYYFFLLLVTNLAFALLLARSMGLADTDDSNYEEN